MNFKKLITSKPRLIFSLVSLVFFGCILLLTFTNAFKLLNLKSFDLLHNSINRLQYRKPLVAPLPNVLIINIDSEFIKSLKTYPIPRKYYGFILNSLENSNVLATGLSIIFTEDLCNKALLPFLNKKIVTGSLIYKNNHLECTDEINKKTSSGFLNADLDIDGSLRRILLRKKNK